MAQFKRYLPLLILGLGLVLVLTSDLGRFLNLQALRTHEAALRDLIAHNLPLALLAFIGVYALSTALSVPGGVILTLAGGYLFGLWVGGAATVVGATIGAIAVFYAVRTSLGAVLRQRAEATQGRLKAIIDGVAAGAFGYILTLRLIPLAPFWLVNVAAALAHAPLAPYALATFIGIIPATFIYSGIGAGVGDLLARNEAPDLGVIFQPNILGPLVALGLLSLGVTLYQRRRGKTGETL